MIEEQRGEEKEARANLVLTASLVEDALLFLSLLDNHLHGRIQNIRSPIKFDLAGMCESTLSSSRDV
jgi:hypothetical protein